MANESIIQAALHFVPSKEVKMVELDVYDVVRVKEIINHRIRFQLPLDHNEPNGQSITIMVNITQKYDEKLHGKDKDKKTVLPENPKLICYLQGGPGFPCAVPLSNSAYTKVLLDRGYQIVYLDQRGTGLSTLLDVETFNQLVPRKVGENDDDYTKRQLKFILNFRADSIVHDAEMIRERLIGESKWSIIGQSYGGFTSFTYVSMYPDSLKEVLVTGGVPPIGYHADDVYTATYERTRERNIHYYEKYPQDKQKVRNILNYLSKNHVKLPNGGVLSVERFQQIGLGFGGLGGTDNIHQLVLKFDHDLELFGKPTHNSLISVQNNSSFGTNIIYALFQEAIYCDGPGKPTNWSADRLRYKHGNEQFVHTTDSDTDIYFTGEMVYKSMWDDFVELQPFKNLAIALHENTEWSKLYDIEKLKETSWEKVSIVAATYVYDQYVDFDLTRNVKNNIFKDNGNLKQFITSEFFHNGIRTDSEKVIGSLLSLLDCEID